MLFIKKVKAKIWLMLTKMIKSSYM